MNHPEHNLQVKVNQFVRECVPGPHLFFSIDRTAKRSPLEHVRQKARGLVAGTSDTILLCPHIPALVIELKAPGNKPGETQERFGLKVQESGHIWSWCDSVMGYATLVLNAGVDLMGRWDLVAARYDAVLLGAAIKSEETKTGKVSRKRFLDPPSKSKLRAVERIRASGVRI